MNATIHSMQTDRRYYGVVEALVVANDDPEKEGRVKLRFPWFANNTTSEWCRVSQFYAGPGSSGAFFVPEKDSEVLVSFIHGDMRQPIVIGCLYNGVDKPATYRDKGKDEKQLRTRAGHCITLVDTEGEERIVIEDKSGEHTIEVSTRDNAISVRSSGTLTLEANQIEIKAKAGLMINAETIKEEAKVSRETKAGAITAEAEGDMTLKGKLININ